MSDEIPNAKRILEDTEGRFTLLAKFLSNPDEFP